MHAIAKSAESTRSLTRSWLRWRMRCLVTCSATILLRASSLLPHCSPGHAVLRSCSLLTGPPFEPSYGAAALFLAELDNVVYRYGLSSATRADIEIFAPADSTRHAMRAATWVKNGQ